MIALLSSFLILFASPFKSKSRLDAENAVFGHQLIILRRKVRGQRPPTKRSSRRIASPLPASLSFRYRQALLSRWHSSNFVRQSLVVNFQFPCFDLRDLVRTRVRPVRYAVGSRHCAKLARRVK